MSAGQQGDPIIDVIPTSPECPAPRRQRQRRGRGEGSVFQRKDGTWCVRISIGYRPDGKPKGVDRYAPTKSDALKKLRELQNDRVAGWATRAERITLKTYLEHWLKNDVRVSREPSTYDSYKRTLACHVIPFIGGTQVTKLSPADIKDLYARLEAGTVPAVSADEIKDQYARLEVETVPALDRDILERRRKQSTRAVKQKRSAKTRHNIHAVLRCALNDAVRDGLIVKNPCDAVTAPRYRIPEVRYWSAEQGRTFLKAIASDRLEALYALALTMGSRQGELFGLKWTDVDWERKAININRTLNESSGKRYVRDGSKTGRGHRVDIGDNALAALKRRRERTLAEGNRATEYIFCDTEGNPLRRNNVIRRSYKPLLEAAGLPYINFHALRHTCATALLESGEDVKAVSERLGHADVATTLRMYAHVTPTMQKRAAAKADRLFGTDQV
jgi:integrase